MGDSQRNQRFFSGCKRSFFKGLSIVVKEFIGQWLLEFTNITLIKLIHFNIRNNPLNWFLNNPIVIKIRRCVREVTMARYLG